MSDFESDSDTDSELGPGQQEVLSTLLWIQEGDIVRFSPADNSNVFNGLVDGITRDQDEDIRTITIRHLDQKHKDILCEYPCPYGFRWITRQQIETPAIEKFVDLKTNMLIRTRVANGGEVRG